MVEVQIDGKTVEIAEGSMVIHAADKAGMYIPHFCYHKKLSIVASCRMCLVDIEKAPKPMPACATPVTQGMVVNTRTQKAISAQKSVMEFLLINHPLDCPVCDQGGECQLQDLAVGYGMSSTRYEEEKRVVQPKDVGPLISMQEMTRCIHCTRCVRFGQEIGGVMEFGMSNRGEFSEIETFIGNSVDSELSGNMIDVCPVGALTSKPFRFAARTWELSRRKSVSPHDSTGANLIVQVKNGKVMRVLPFENEDVNECWIADRDRFSYEALNGEDRLKCPMIKQGGVWQEVDWQTALEYVSNGLANVITEAGPQKIGALVSPHSTLEEIYLAKSLIKKIGSDNIDYRLRNTQFNSSKDIYWLGTQIAELSKLDSVFVVGSNLRKDHPLFAQRIRQAARAGCVVSSLTSKKLLRDRHAWAMPIKNINWAEPEVWIDQLASIAIQVAKKKNVSLPQELCDVTINQDEVAVNIANALLNDGSKAILLGNAAAHHPQAGSLLALCQWLGEQTGSRVGYLTEAANTVGAQWVKAFPEKDGANAQKMLSGCLDALILLNTEPESDAAFPLDVSMAGEKRMVVTLSPFKANMKISDVLLPIAPFSETSGTFINAEGRIQSFHAVVKPQGEARPAWKVLRVLGDMLGLDLPQFQSSQEVRDEALSDMKEQTVLPLKCLSLAERAPIVLGEVKNIPRDWGIYELDSIVRRASSLQQTADAKNYRSVIGDLPGVSA